MSDRRFMLGSLLIDLECEMRSLQLWVEETPSPEALQSKEPFCIDTLNFDQWLQFVFLPTLHFLLESDAELPEECSVTPMAEEYFGSTAPGVLSSLLRIDELLTGGDV